MSTLAACVVVSLPAVTVSAAGNTAAFLKIPVGARPMSLGGAYTALSDDASASFWNPAGLVGIGRQFAATDAELFADTRYDTFSYAQPVGSVGIPGSVGLSMGYLSQGKIEGRSANGSRTGGFTASDMVLGVSYARPAFDRAKLGLTLKFIQSQIADTRATGYAADVGGIVKTGFRGLNVGMTVKNLGPGMTFIEERSRLPTTVSIGVSKNFGPLILVGDASRLTEENRNAFGMGMEVPLLSAVSVRGGYYRNAEAGSSGGLGAGLNGLGAGFGFGIFGANLDYAFTPAGELGNAQRLSISAAF